VPGFATVSGSTSTSVSLASTLPETPAESSLVEAVSSFATGASLAPLTVTVSVAVSEAVPSEAV
jgi:hypothetical protein